MFEPKLQEYFDTELEKETREIKEEYLEKEAHVLNKEAQADFEVQQARNQMSNLRKTFHEKQQSWAKETFIEYVTCFGIGYLVAIGVILGG